MKMKLYARTQMILLLGMLSALLLSGCAYQPVRSTETLFPTDTATLIATTMPTLTPIPTITLTNIPTSTHTPIPPPAPTLSVEQAQAKLLELLSKNGDCRLPCLWGITPGKSTYQEAQSILASFSNISVSTSFKTDSGVIRPVYMEGDSRLGIDIGFVVDNQIIKEISFHGTQFKDVSDHRLPIYDSKTFGDRLRPYMLSAVLSALGKPDSVILHSYGKDVGYEFEIVLLYPKQGVLAHYTTSMKVIGANVRGCPANAHVELELYPSGDADSFVRSLSSILIWEAFVQPEPINNEHWKQIENATSMSVEQFYETFREPTDKCIETPLKGWYVPEQ